MGNMIELPKIKPKAVSVLKQCTHHNSLVRIENRNRRSRALSPGETHSSQVRGVSSTPFYSSSASTSKRSFQSLQSRERHQYFSGLSRPLGVRETIGEHDSRSYCHARKRFLIALGGPLASGTGKSQPW